MIYAEMFSLQRYKTFQAILWKIFLLETDNCMAEKKLSRLSFVRLTEDTEIDDKILFNILFRGCTCNFHAKIS